jgi:hypothetical protein
MNIQILRIKIFYRPFDVYDKFLKLDKILLMIIFCELECVHIALNVLALQLKLLVLASHNYLRLN